MQRLITNSALQMQSRKFEATQYLISSFLPRPENVNCKLLNVATAIKKPRGSENDALLSYFFKFVETLFCEALVFGRTQ